MNTLITIAAVLNLSVCGGVKTGKLLGWEAGSDALLEIDLDTGEATILHSFDVEPTGLGLAVGPNGTLYAAFGGDVEGLVIVDPVTGELSVVGPFGFEAVSGLAFGPDGTLYGVDEVSDQLITIDALTGEGTAVGFTGVSNHQGLAFTPDGTLYLVGTPGLESILYTVDPDTGEATQVGRFGSNLRFSAAVESIGEVLYASAYDPFDAPYDVLVTLDPETGDGPLERELPRIHDLDFKLSAG
ncbi:MAG: hypothetical protein IH988_11265, partial [Planctomycetes bacterium]|nr:hypothetical protein [Planctomycetota bacterium]